MLMNFSYFFIRSPFAVNYNSIQCTLLWNEPSCLSNEVFDIEIHVKKNASKELLAGFESFIRTKNSENFTKNVNWRTNPTFLLSRSRNYELWNGKSLVILTFHPQVDLFDWAPSVGMAQIWGTIWRAIMCESSW